MCERSQQIDKILTSKRADFKAWQKINKVRQTVKIPEGITDVFIPRRVLELARNPDLVKTLLKESRPNYLGIFVYEHCEQPLTDENAWKKWREDHPRGLLAINNPYTTTDAPVGIDYQHIRYWQFLELGKLDFNDKIYLNYMLTIPEGFPHVVTTVNLYDRPELHGQGIGASLYERVESILKDLEFKYLTEQIFSPHPEFFRKRRELFEELSPEKRLELPLYPPQFGDIKWMVKTL